MLLSSAIRRQVQVPVLHAPSWPRAPPLSGTLGSWDRCLGSAQVRSAIYSLVLSERHPIRAAPFRARAWHGPGDSLPCAVDNSRRNAFFRIFAGQGMSIVVTLPNEPKR